MLRPTLDQLMWGRLEAACLLLKSKSAELFPATGVAMGMCGEVTYAGIIRCRGHVFDV